MTRLVMVCEHPSLHRGFAVVGHHIAHYLSTNDGWQVDYLGRYEPAASPCDFSYRVHAVDPRGDVTGEDLMNALRQLVGQATAAHAPAVPLLSIGVGEEQLLLLDLLERQSLRRHVRFIAYLPIDFSPLPPLFGRLLAAADLLVPYTSFARRVMEAWCSNAAVPADKIAEPIPHGVRTDVFRPSLPDVRRKVRRSVFGLDEESLLVGYFGRNTKHKRSELAVRIFHLVAKGRYVRCRDCECVGTFALDPANWSTYPPGACADCGSHNLDLGRAMPGARLYLHTDLLSGAAAYRTGGWDLELLASRLGIADQIIWNSDLHCGRGIPAEELALRMSACDIHLLPFEGGGWELTVLETGACGVANVITDFAAPPEYAAPFSLLIPVSMRVYEPTGVRGLMDISSAVAALVHLAEKPAERRVLGEAGVHVAQQFSWPRVVKQWHSLLAR